MKTMNSAILWVLLLLVGLVAAGYIACGDDDDDDDDLADPGDDDDDTSDDDDDSADDDDDDYTGPTWEGGELVFIDTYDGIVSVKLEGLPAFEWIDPDDQLTKMAVKLSTVVQEAFDKIQSSEIDPTGWSFNLISSTTADVLADTLGHDFRNLPEFADLDKGWFIQYEATVGTKYTDIKVAWDASLSYPAYMNTEKMSGGTIQMVEQLYFDQSVTLSVEWDAKNEKGSVDLNGLPAFYDGEQMAVYLNLVIDKAALSGFDQAGIYRFDFVNSSDWSLLTDGLGDDLDQLPKWIDQSGVKDVRHGWIMGSVDDGYVLAWDDATTFLDIYDVTNMDGGTIVAYDQTPVK